MDYYLSMKQILLTQISTLCQQRNEFKSNGTDIDCISNDLCCLQTALEQIKSYKHNEYFVSMLKQFKCELNQTETNTLKYLTQNHKNNDQNDIEYEWIFYRGFKQWMQTIYIQNNTTAAIANTTRSETLFIGAQTEHLNHLFTENHSQILDTWQTLLGLHLLTQYKSQQITKKDIMGKKAVMDITKCIHYKTTTNNKIISSALMRLSIVQNNIFKTKLKCTLQPHIIRIYNADIFKIAASILWHPTLAANIINICVSHKHSVKTSQRSNNKPQNFAEAFKIQQKKRLSHTQNESTNTELPDIPHTPTDNNIDTNKNLNIEQDDTNIISSNAYAPTTALKMQEQAKNRPSFNLEDEDDDENEFFDHHGQHESAYSGEFSIPAQLILPAYPDTKLEEEVDEDTDTDSIHTEYVDSDDADQQENKSETNINDLNRDTEHELSSDSPKNDHAPHIKPQRLARTGTMVEYDVENILSGDTVHSQTTNTLSVKSIKDVPALPPLQLSASTPDLTTSKMPVAFNIASKAVLHGHYKNATSAEERWKRLKQRINRHWDEDVTAKMKTFCLENEYEFEDILEDINDTLISIDSSNIISHLKKELFWNEAKTLRFYRTLRRILISRQSTQFISQFGSYRNLCDDLTKNDMVISLKGHAGYKPGITMQKLQMHTSMQDEPMYVRRTSHELQMEKAWWCISQSLLQNNWGHTVVIEFKQLCIEQDFNVALIIDDIGCFDNGDSLLMPALASRLKWTDAQLLKFVGHLRIALTDDMQRLARLSRDVKRVEIPTIEFQRTDSISISTSVPSPNLLVNEHMALVPFATLSNQISNGSGNELEIPIALETANKFIKYEEEQTPPILSRKSTPATNSGRSITSFSSLRDRMIDVSDHESVLKQWKQQHIHVPDGDSAVGYGLIMYDESVARCKCLVIDECAVYKRIMFIMDFYLSYIVYDDIYHQISIHAFISRLCGYTYTQLWNDYFHIRSYHTMNNPNWNLCGTDVCIAATCRILSRYHRNRTLCKDNEARLEMYNLKEANQTYEVITQQLCDIIHCLLFHPIAVNTNNYKKLTVQMSVDSEAASNRSNSNGLVEDDDESVPFEADHNENEQKEEELLGIGVKIVDSAMYTKLREKRMQFHKFLTVDERMGCNHNDSYKYKFKNENDSQLKRKNHRNNKKQHNKSWRALPGLSCAAEEKSEWEIFLSLNMKNLESYSKYAEFHDELLNNSIFNISCQQWDDCWKRSELFKQTWKGKQMLSKNNSPGFRMRKGDPIPTHYIMALMIWCNFDSLQCNFRSHCKNIQLNRGNERFQFSRWGFWLNACIECYGDNIAGNQQFYCCIDSQIMLNEMWLRFAYPTSISSSFLITQIYSNNKYNRDGVIFVLNKGIKDSVLLLSYINCEWISDYGYEECEYLIFNGSLDVKSMDLNLKNNNNYDNFAKKSFDYYTPLIFTLKWWDIMTNVSQYKYFHNELGDDGEKILLQLLNNKSNNIIIPDYVRRLFVNLCRRKFLDINLTLLDELLLSSLLKERFIDGKDGRIDFWRLISLFPNAKKFNIRLQKGLELDSFICGKFLNTIDRCQKKYKVDFKLSCVVLTADQQNRNLKQQTKNLLKSFRSRSWMIFFTKAGNKMKFEKNTNFIKK